MAPLMWWMLLHFVLAAVGTWWARAYAISQKMLDQPGDRRSHVVATPRGGGISIVLVILLGISWLAMHWPGHLFLLACFGAGLVLVAGIGWIDDHRPLSASLRLGVQAVAALVLAWGVYITTDAWLFAALAFGLVMALVNIWNFMDGIDGLAASQAGIVAAGLALVLGGGVWTWLAAGLAAASAGFLPFNFPKARIFLGDVGSGALGYVLAGLLLAGLASTRVAWPLLFLPFAAFFVDASFTLLMRILRKQRWWEPHVTHTYQYWAKRVANHIPVTTAYALFTLAGVMLMLGGLSWHSSAAACISLVWYVIAFLFWAQLRRDVSMGKETQ